MLAVCLHKLCTQDSFENHSFRLELCGNCSPEGWNIAPWSLQNGLLEASGGLLGARWAPFGRQGRSEADFRRLWGALGALLAALGAVLKLLEPLLGRPGPLLGASWGSFWASWPVFGRHFAALGASWGALGAS